MNDAVECDISEYLIGLHYIHTAHKLLPCVSSHVLSEMMFDSSSQMNACVKCEISG